MAGFDKFVLMEQLIAAGWKEVEPEKMDPDLGPYQLRATPEMVSGAHHKIFHVYDARKLMDLICEDWDTDDD